MMKNPWLVTATLARPWPNHLIVDTVGVTVIDNADNKTVLDFGKFVGADSITAAKIV